MPPHDPTDVQMMRLSAFVTAQVGLRFAPDAWPDLLRGVEGIARERGLADADACIQWLLAPPVTSQHIALLARHLTIGETYFFRESAALDAVEKRILPALIQARRAQGRRLRIWSAACCTGEEPYTIAIILQKLLPDWKQWDITILGTDINPQFLQQAHEGIYRERSFRTTPVEIRERCFIPVAEGYAIRPEVKQMVTFAPLNLAGGIYPALATNTLAMDLIFCRNVLMYFSKEVVARVLTSFHQALADDGWLVASASEASPMFSAQYEMVSFPDAILFKKRSQPAPALPIQPPSPARPAARAATPTRRTPQQPAAHDVARVRPPGLPPGVPKGAPPAQAVPSSWEQAQALYQAGHYSAAGDQLRTLVGQGQSEVAALGLLARVEANQGQLDSALAWSERAIAADKLNPALHYLHATILQEQGALREAAAGLWRALYLDPDFVLAHFALGNLTLAQGKATEAHKYFAATRRLLRAYPPDTLLPEAEGLTAGRLDAIAIAMLTRTEVSHDPIGSALTRR